MGMWVAVGGLGAIALGIILIPLRAVTAASNLAFAFLVLTIVMAEIGGRTAALATALVSAMSLDFFLTEPYLALTISKTDDVIAFVGLVVCGLIAAAFGRQRARVSEAAVRTQKELGVLKAVVEKLDAGAPLDAVLDDLRWAFKLGAVVLRDADERVLAVAPPGSAPGDIPEVSLMPDTLMPSADSWHELGVRGFRLPPMGGRLRLQTDRGSVSLDLWEGDARGLDLDERRTLSIAASMLALGVGRPPTGRA